MLSLALLLCSLCAMTAQAFAEDQAQASPEAADLVEQDLKSAAEWYQKALDAGYVPDATDRQHLADLLGKATF